MDLFYSASHQYFLWAVLRRSPYSQYIFAHVSEPYNPNSYKNYYFGHSPSKLVLFSVHYPEFVFIPCVPCESQVERLAKNRLTLQKVDVAWNAQNLNLRGHIVKHLGWPPPSPQDGLCGPSLTQFHQSTSTEFCSLYILRQKYNVTYRHWSTMDDMDNQNCYGMIQFSSILSNASIVIVLQNYIPVYHVTFENVRFSIVTSFPSVRNDFATFLLPFDKPTWILLIVASIMTSTLTLVDVSYFGFVYRFGVKEYLYNHLFQLAALLLGQSANGDVTKIFANKRVSIVISIVWLFGCYILMANLYQGSMFSFLTVPQFPW